MLTRTVPSLLLIGAAGLGAASRAASPKDFTVHEWGTFTTVAGEDGRAVDWLPLGGPTDLPCFVEHFQERGTAKIIPIEPNGAPLDYEHARSLMVGRVRMETPVLYFYAPRDMSASVKVRFPRGLMTEWFPHANVAQMVTGPMMLKQPNLATAIEWPSIHLSPGGATAFQKGTGASHYYAARATEATPVTISNQHERFLFYRGIADFDVPIAAAALPNGRLRITNVGDGDIPAAIVFERRGRSLGYRVLGALKRDTTVDAPALDGTMDGLHAELERVMLGAGLWPKEAAAMLKTWRDSWFEEGTRVFYLVPPRAVDGYLPLEVKPSPDHVTRVFVGRMEVITATTQAAVEHAIATNDMAVLDKYNRFLGPIADRVLTKTSTAAERERIRSVTNAALASYLKRAAVCE